MLPAGEFERTKFGSRTVVVPGTYRAVDAQPVRWHGVLTAPVKWLRGVDWLMVRPVGTGAGFLALGSTVVRW